MSDPATVRDGADSESYVSRNTRKLATPDPSKSLRTLMKSATVAHRPELPKDGEMRPTPAPVITEAIIAENRRRVQASASSTLVTIHPDGKRSYKADIVARGDGIKDTLATDRGEGTTDSLDLLAKEGNVRVQGLLDQKRRDSAGRFISKSETKP